MLHSLCPTLCSGGCLRVNTRLNVLSVFITPWMKPSNFHGAISCACRAMTPSSKRAIRLRSLRRLRIVAGDCVSRPACVRLLYRHVPRSTGRCPRAGGSPQPASARLPAATSRAAPTLRLSPRKCPRGGHAKRRHRLAHNVLTQYRPQRGSAVSPARERSPPEPLSWRS